MANSREEAAAEAARVQAFVRRSERPIIASRSRKPARPTAIPPPVDPPKEPEAVAPLPVVVSSPPAEPRAATPSRRARGFKEEQFQQSAREFDQIVRALNAARDDPNSPEFIDLNNLRGLRIWGD